MSVYDFEKIKNWKTYPWQKNASQISWKLYLFIDSNQNNLSSGFSWLSHNLEPE